MRTFAELMQEGYDHLQAERWAEAADLFDATLARNPKLGDAANGLGIALQKLNRIGGAVAAFTHAVTVAPESPDAWANYGATLRHAGHTEWGRAAYQQALAKHPGHAGALNGMAGSYVNEGNPAEGVVWGSKAAAAKDAPIPAHLNLALCLMELGRWDEAWPHWRRRVIPGCVERHYPGERWRGEDVDWLIVHGEQGLGDEVMFLGCLPELMDRAHSGVILEVNPRLVPLVRASFPGVTVIGKPEEFVHPGRGTIAVAALGDLPEFCAGGVPPKRSGYFTAARHPDDRVLLAMRGGTMGTHDYLRNPPLDDWRPVVETIRAAGLRPVSIQYGQGGDAMAATLGIDHDANAAGDRTAQAEAIASCRALVSVQQTALHLGGALGTPVYGVIGNKPAWRYGISGAMPWYQTVSLYRQAADEKGWGPVMDRVAAVLARLRVGVAA